MLTWGLFLCGYSMASEEKEVSLLMIEEMRAALETKWQNDAHRNPPVPEPVKRGAAAVRCARGVYSFDCAPPASVMKADLQRIEPPTQRDNDCRNFLSPGWRCD